MKIYSCSACTHDHDEVKPTELDTPEDINGVTYTHHFFCPETGTEVFVRFYGVAHTVEGNDGRS